MADRRKLSKGLMMMTPAMREDLAGREQDIQRGKTVELLRRAGKEMYENPIVNTAIGFTPGVGDVQAAGETFAALQRGAPWQETAGYAVGMLPFVPALRTTWHGSPHGFTKFDMSKIGTGEGAQAYGHGLYLADAPETATSYAKPAIKDIRMTPEGKMFDLNTGETIGPIQGFPKHEDLLKDKQGYLYKVDLPDEQIAKMLDWDKPLSEQSAEIQELARNLDISNAIGRNKGVMQAWREGRDVGITPRGEHLYESLAGSGKYQPQASQTLYKAGIPGIQYLDQASRGAGEGTRNYVVFSDEIPQILERNGQPVAQALRNYAPKIDEATGLPLNEQGMVTVYHHTNPEAAKQIAETGRLRSAGEPDVYVTSWDKPDTGYGESVVPIQVDPSVLRLDDEFPSGRMDFAIPVGKSGEFIFKGNK